MLSISAVFSILRLFLFDEVAIRRNFYWLPLAVASGASGKNTISQVYRFLLREQCAVQVTQGFISLAGKIKSQLVLGVVKVVCEPVQTLI